MPSMRPQDFSSVVDEQQQQQQSRPNYPGTTGQSDPQGQPSLHDQFKGLQSSLANTIGNAATAAKSSGLPEQATQEIVRRAYRQEW